MFLCQAGFGGQSPKSMQYTGHFLQGACREPEAFWGSVRVRNYEATICPEFSSSSPPPLENETVTGWKPFRKGEKWCKENLVLGKFGL